jgi:PAS domain S-box-containing protein
MSVDDGERFREPASARDARLIVGRRGIIEDIDAAGCALLGYAREDVIGLHGSELVPPDSRPSTAASLDRMRLGEISRREGRVLRRDGTILAVEVTAQRAPGGRLTLSLKKLPGA